VTLPYVVIGGDAAGMSAAAKIKRTQPDAEVIVFERTDTISYSACGMPYWISGLIPSDRQLIVMTPEIARKRRQIDVRIHHEVTAIDPATHTVHGRHTDTGAPFDQPYAKLLIATGARAVKPPLPGMDLPGVFSLRALADARRIHAYLDTQNVQRAVVVGAGYIGAEMVEALRDRGIDVTLLELKPQIMPAFDADMVAEVTQHLRDRGVHVQTAVALQALHAVDGHLHLSLAGADGANAVELDADLAIIATGVRPNVEFAAAAGLRIGSTGAIWVDTAMRTSAPDIFAAGDCAEHYHLVLQRNAWIPLATSANKGGRIAGENMLGAHATLPGILGTAVVKVFDYTMSITGLSEFEARQSRNFGESGEFVGAAIIENKDKVAYWPNAETMQVKLVFDTRNGRVIGGQLVGKEGVNKRIDIIATAITAGMTVSEITVLDLSYAPPYSPTYDPIQICAAQAEKLVTGTPA
jgi:NADPH-dependent 2,4-dienoyl-CoA reductase/sulfur reductase-like enzyme